MNKEKTGISPRYVENLMGSKATQKLIQAIEEKNTPSECKTKEHCVSNEHAIDESTAKQEEQTITSLRQMQSSIVRKGLKFAQATGKNCHEK